MTIASTVNRDTYVGAGSAGPFAYGFRIFAASDLLVVTRDPNGLETTLSYPGEFTVTGIGNAAGGTISLTTPLANNWALSIRRVRPLTQETQLRNQGPYYPETVEDAFDNAMMIAQQLEDSILRSVRVPESVAPSAFDPTLPANLQPGDALVVNQAGTGFSMAVLSAAQLSAWNAAQNMKLDVFTSAHGDFTPGTTTILTLSAAPGSVANISVTRRTSGSVAVYESDEYTISGTTLTFTSAIPASTTRVEVRYLYTYQVNTADAANVTYAPLSGPGTDVRSRLRLFDNRVASVSISITDAPYSADPTGVVDAAAAFNAASAAVDTLGGGEVIVPRGIFKIDAVDITVTRTVNVRGAGAGGSFLRSVTGKRLRVTGAEPNWDHLISHVAFDGVQVRYGNTSADFGNGCCLAHAEVMNCAVGVYYGWNCFQNTIHNTKLHDNTVCVQYDLATGGTTSGAIECISGGSALFNSAIGIHYTGGGVSGFDCFLTDINIEHMTQAGILLEGADEDCVFINNCHFELYGAAAYFIVTDGGHIFLDGFWALSETEAAWFSISGGEIYVIKGRGSWAANKFANITGGTIVVDPDLVFCGSRWWGEGLVPMVTAGSNGGQIISARSQYVGQSNKTLTTLTNAAPGPTLPVNISPRDGNERVVRFDVQCTNTSADNTLRISLTNGHSTVRLDLHFPLVDGGATVEVCHTPGGDFSATAAYLPSTAGSGLRVIQATTDTSTLADNRFLALETISGGGTKATMAVTRFYEFVHAPHIVGL